MPYILKHINKWEENHFFVATGATHFSASRNTNLHLISATTKDASRARVFDTAEDADTVLARARNPGGWSVEPVQ